MTLDVRAGGTIEAERGRLASVLEQLVRHSRERAAARVAVTLTESGFTYRDDGRLIPAAEHTEVFDSDTTTTGQGVGLGLEIVRTQVESQGWSISVEQAGERTAFVVTGAETTVETEARR
ncbi:MULTISPECIES: sensor histidine kinase [Haloarcula]|uniref:sensor histidine kinase n=1 Tax=Haloarcula TaxID=2237 RepID=UPI0023E78EF6|nr:ATP-binding protein [Halomicroarcula sp. SHR3]